MSERMKTPAELTSEAMALLTRELGTVDTIRFINQFTNGFGDYTQERESWLGSLTLDEVIAEIRRFAPERPE